MAGKEADERAAAAPASASTAVKEASAASMWAQASVSIIARGTDASIGGKQASAPIVADVTGARTVLLRPGLSRADARASDVIFDQVRKFDSNACGLSFLHSGCNT